MPAPFLEQTLRSLTTQECPSWSLLVVFDGPAGDAKGLIESIIPRGKLTFAVAEGGTGIVAALNTGLASVQTPYVARIDADDLCHPSRVGTLLKTLDSPRRPLLVCSSSTIINESGLKVGNVTVPTADQFQERMVFRNFVVHSSVAFRTKEIRALGGYNMSCDAIEDYDLWLRCARVGTISPIQEELVAYRISEGQISRRASRRSSRLYVMAGQIELGASLGKSRLLTALGSLLWFLGQEPGVRNRFGRLRKLR
ncbi:glycosyltransferase [Dietzia maris]